MIIFFSKVLDLNFCILNFFIQKNRNSHVLVINFGVFFFLRKTGELSILFLLDLNIEIYLKYKIIIFFKSVRLHFLNFSTFLKKIKIVRVSLQFWSFFFKTRKLSSLLILDRNVGIVLKHMIIDIF